MTTETAPAQPISRADVSVVSALTLYFAADQLTDLAFDLERDPDHPLPVELQQVGIGPLQLLGVARWLDARAGLYGTAART